LTAFGVYWMNRKSFHVRVDFFDSSFRTVLCALYILTIVIRCRFIVYSSCVAFSSLRRSGEPPREGKDHPSLFILSNPFLSSQARAVTPPSAFALSRLHPSNLLHPTPPFRSPHPRSSIPQIQSRVHQGSNHYESRPWAPSQTSTQRNS